VITDENPETGNTTWKALPIRGNTNRWGDEIYFSIPVELGEEKGRMCVGLVVRNLNHHDEKKRSRSQS
jgi:hypothetical protein